AKNSFIVWGFLNALYIMPSIIFNTNRNNLDIVTRGKYLPTIKEFLAISITFSLTVFAWIFFRANNIIHAFKYISEIFSSSLLEIPYFTGIGRAVPIVFLTGIFLIVEWIGREHQYAIAHLGLKWYKPIRWAMYYAIIVAISHFTGKEHMINHVQF
ncbi:MAG: MBOAT family protein, partial [Actinobacteria bacterium]|nr:MBOAT family protein [Actinomycetota bacterium]